MSKPTDLTSYAIEGYSAPRDLKRNPEYLWSSPVDAAWRVGKWLQDTGRSAPRNVRASRGDKFHVNDMLVQLNWTQFNYVDIERIR